MSNHSYTGKLYNHDGQVITEINTTGLPLVEVFWDDAWGDPAYLEIDAAGQLVVARRKNAGYLAHYDEERVVITNGTVDNLFHGKTMLAGVETIPWTMIKALVFVDSPDIGIWES